MFLLALLLTVEPHLSKEKPEAAYSFHEIEENIKRFNEKMDNLLKDTSHIVSSLEKQYQLMHKKYHMQGWDLIEEIKEVQREVEEIQNHSTLTKEEERASITH